jgi:hypothetical protein
MDIVFIVVAIGLIILQIVMIVRFFEIASNVKDLREHFLKSATSQTDDVAQEEQTQQSADEGDFSSRGSTGNVIYGYYTTESPGKQCILVVNFGFGMTGSIHVYYDNTASFIDGEDEYIYKSKNDAIDAMSEFLRRKASGSSTSCAAVRKNLIRKKTLQP